MLSIGSGIMDTIKGIRSVAPRSAPEGNCGGLVNTPGQIIKSPNYPRDYDNNVDCQWLIQFYHHDHIRLTFKDFNLENGTSMPFNPCP